MLLVEPELSEGATVPRSNLIRTMPFRLPEGLFLLNLMGSKGITAGKRASFHVLE